MKLFSALLFAFMSLNVAYATNDIVKLKGDVFLAGEQGTFTSLMTLKLKKHNENDFYTEYFAEGAILNENNDIDKDAKMVRLLKSDGSMDFYLFFKHKGSCNVRYYFKASNVDPAFNVGAEVAFEVTELESCVCGWTCASSYKKKGLVHLEVISR